MLTIDFKRLGIQPQDRILDIGCGEGRHTITACRHQGTHCVGADFGYDNLLQTRNKIEFHRHFDEILCKCVDLSCMDITDMPFKDKCFDFVICSEVLEHIPDDTAAISELYRIVKPGKTLAVSVPRSWPEKICWILSKEYRTADMGHVRIYDRNSLIRKIESFGFSFTGSHFAHSIHTPFWWLKCLFGPDRTDVLPVNLYHELLVWDMMKKPALTRFIDRLFNPIFGKSVVLYFSKIPG